MSERIRERALPIPPASIATLCREIYERFSANPDLLAIPVLQDMRPVGLINREDFMLRLADQYGRALFEGKPVTSLMETAPLIIEGEETLDNVGRYVATERPSALLKGFIIVERGVYLGVVSGLRLLQGTVERLVLQTGELERARLAAEMASQAKSTFLATMSHELRTPLNAIIGFAGFILTEPHGQIAPSAYGDYIRDIAASGEHLLKLINDILDMSRVESGRLELWYSTVDPLEIIHSSIRMLLPQMEAARHELQLDLDHDLPEMIADERTLKQILVNLLSNAVKFTPPGGRITVTARRVNEEALLFEIRDNGVGIPPEKIGTVMTPFGQVDSSLSRRHEGTGLGLPLVKAFVEAHGGRFALESVPHGGTTARVEMPLTATPAQGDLRPPMLPDPPRLAVGG